MMRCGWGNDAFTLFIVHKTQGLIKGAYSVEFGPGEACERVFNELVLLCGPNTPLSSQQRRSTTTYRLTSGSPIREPFRLTCLAQGLSNWPVAPAVVTSV